MSTRPLARTAGLLLALSFLGQAVPAVAQQMGREPWRAPARNASVAAQFQQQDRNNAAAATAAGLGALHQFVTTYNSSSTSIGNYNEVTQILEGGSVGSIGQSDQASQGNQGADASTDVLVDNSLTDRSQTNISGNNTNNSTSTSTTNNFAPPARPQ